MPKMLTVPLKRTLCICCGTPVHVERMHMMTCSPRAPNPMLLTRVVTLIAQFIENEGAPPRQFLIVSFAEINCRCNRQVEIPSM